MKSRYFIFSVVAAVHVGGALSEHVEGKQTVESDNSLYESPELCTTN